MEAAWPSEALVSNYNPEDLDLNLHHHENLNSRNTTSVPLTLLFTYETEEEISTKLTRMSSQHYNLKPFLHQY
jgi:hypothetical protein